MVKVLALRRILVAWLALALALGSVARAASAGEASRPTTLVVAGVAVSLCAGDAAAANPAGLPADLAHHDCDHCMLASPVVTPPPSAAAHPLRFAVPIGRASLQGDALRECLRLAAAFPRGPPVS